MLVELWCAGMLCTTLTPRSFTVKAIGQIVRSLFGFICVSRLFRLTSCVAGRRFIPGVSRCRGAIFISAIGWLARRRGPVFRPALASGLLRRRRAIRSPTLTIGLLVLTGEIVLAGLICPLVPVGWSNRIPLTVIPLRPIAAIVTFINISIMSGIEIVLPFHHAGAAVVRHDVTRLDRLVATRNGGSSPLCVVAVSLLSSP